MGSRTLSGLRRQTVRRVKRLRVLHVDAGTTWRGGQRQALLLALGLRDRGHEPFLIAQPESPLLTRARSAGLAAAAISMRADWDLSAARRIRSRVKAWNADVLHAHDARSQALGISALLGRKVPLIVTRRVAFIPRSVRIKYGGRVSRFIAISNAVRDAMVAGGIAASRIDVVHSGILMPTGHIAPRDWRTELGWPADSIVCGMVGAMTKEKGLDILDTILRSMSAGARTRTRLVLLGGEARGHMEMGGVPAFSPGFVPGIEEAVAGLDVLLHPSNLEGLGTSVIDAMAVGVPPVAFAVGGIPEVVVDGQSGLLAPPASVADFAAAAERLILDEGLRRALGAAAIDRAKTFSAEAMTKGTEAVYERVLTG